MRISDWSSDVCSSDLRWGNEWDIAAAALIVTEAGGKVTDALGNALSFNADPPRAFGVLAAAPGIHSAAVRHLQAQAAELAARSRSSGSGRSEEHTSELQSLMRTSYAVFCLNKKTGNTQITSLNHSTS